MSRAQDRSTGVPTGAQPNQPDQPVTGTWRDGYVELTVSGTWPQLPGSVTATLAGWIDKNSGTGRMKIDNLTDGRWTATRKE